jgi:hypothetical protein
VGKSRVLMVTLIDRLPEFSLAMFSRNSVHKRLEFSESFQNKCS